MFNPEPNFPSHLHYQPQDDTEDTNDCEAFFGTADGLPDTKSHQHHSPNLPASQSTLCADPAEAAFFFDEADAQNQLTRLHCNRFREKVVAERREPGARPEDPWGVTEEELGRDSEADAAIIDGEERGDVFE